MAHRLTFAVVFALMASLASAQEVKGPQVASLFVEVFPVSNSPNKTIFTADYNVRALEIGKLKLTVLGFVDVEPQGKRKFYFTNNNQVVKYGAIPVGLMLEEAADRNEKKNNQIDRFGRIGPVANLNDVPIVRRGTKLFAKVANVSWLKAAYGNIQDEVKIYLVSKDLPVGIGSLNLEGFYRVRYGSKPNFGQPQVNFQPEKLKWLKVVCELEQSGRNWDVYLGARATLIKR